MLKTELKVRPALGVEPGQGVKYSSTNKIIPRRQDMVAVEEKEDNEYKCGNEMGRFEELVVTLPTI